MPIDDVFGNVYTVTGLSTIQLIEIALTLHPGALLTQVQGHPSNGVYYYPIEGHLKILAINLVAISAT